MDFQNDNGASRAERIPLPPGNAPDGPEYFDVLGIPISVTSLEDASATLHRWAKDDRGRFVFVRDIFGLMQGVENPELYLLHRRAGMVTPDGMPLVWLGRLARKPVSRTSGADFMDQVFRDSEVSGLKHYFYGGKPGVAVKLREKVLQRFPNLNIVGLDYPPFRPLTPEELASAAEAMNASGADVIWIGISTPKQEFLMADLQPFVRATLVGVGAAFDFQSGAVRRAPRWMQNSGLEWAWRLASEPRRLWRRYVFVAPRFVFRLLANAVGVR